MLKNKNFQSKKNSLSDEDLFKKFGCRPLKIILQDVFADDEERETKEQPTHQQKEDDDYPSPSSKETPLSDDTIINSTNFDELWSSIEEVMDYNNFVLHPSIVDEVNKIDWGENLTTETINPTTSTNFNIDEKTEIEIKINLKCISLNPITMNCSITTNSYKNL